MIKSKALELADAFGYLTQAEVMALQVVAASVTEVAPIIINFGAGSGTSGLAFREGRQDARIYTIDKSPGGPEGGLENEINAFRNAGMFDSLPIQYLADSAAFGNEWFKSFTDTPKVDIVFIDGDHSMAGLNRDIEAWQRLVKPGGYLMFHDYGSPNWPDVKVLVDKVVGERWLLVDTLMVIKTGKQGL